MHHEYVAGSEWTAAHKIQFNLPLAMGGRTDMIKDLKKLEKLSREYREFLEGKVLPGVAAADNK